MGAAPLWLIVAGGALLGLGYPPFNFAPAAWVALVPLLWRWTDARTAAGMFAPAFAFNLALFGVAFSWPLRHAMPHVAVASFAGVVALPLYLSLPYLVAIPLRRRFGMAAGWVLLLSLYLLAEAALSRGPLALPWTLLGHSQAEWPTTRGLARWGGVPLITAWLFLVNAGLVAALKYPHRRSAAIGGLALLGLLPFAAATGHKEDGASRVLRVGVIQPAVPALEWANADGESRLGLLLHLSDRLLAQTAPPPQLLVWPETALPAETLFTGNVTESLQRWVNRTGVPLLSGAVVWDARNKAYHNAAHLFQPERRVQTYRKRHLVPFAERDPLASLLPGGWSLSLPAGGVESYAPGGDARPLDLQGSRLGVLICLESVFSAPARAYAADGADLLVVLSQDGWWGESAGYRQHLSFTRFRAVETGLPVLMVSVSGASALTSPDGQSVWEAGWMDRTAAVLDIPLP